MKPAVSSPAPPRRASFDATLRSGPTESHLVAPAARPNIQSQEHNGAGPSGLSKWDAALGNIEDARVAFEVVARAVEDAVYLDEEAFNQVHPIADYTQAIKSQQKRISQLEFNLRETRLQLEESNSIQSEALQRHAEMQQELENNAVVFKMHYQELLAKDDEIEKLKAVIQALSGR